MVHRTSRFTLSRGWAHLTDVAKFSPLFCEHITILGVYSFSMPKAVANGELRPLRDLTDPSQT